MSTCIAAVIDNSIHFERDELLESVQATSKTQAHTNGVLRTVPPKEHINSIVDSDGQNKSRMTRLVKMGTTRMIGKIGPDGKGKLDPIAIGDLEPNTLEA
jgi:hypothetical protein